MATKRESQIERTITENADKDSLWAVAYAMLRLASAIRGDADPGKARMARLTGAARRTNEADSES